MKLEIHLSLGIYTRKIYIKYKEIDRSNRIYVAKNFNNLEVVN